MSAHRYWRLVGLRTYGSAGLAISELNIYVGAAIADSSADISSSIAPASGALSDLSDGLTSSVVSWLLKDSSAPQFSINWDFGSGGDVEVAGFRLGSGPDRGAYPFTWTLQYSDDFEFWATSDVVSWIYYPGASTLTIAPPTSGFDPYFDMVPVLLNGNGTPGATPLMDEALAPNSITPVGTVEYSSAQSRFGGSSLYFDGSSGLVIPATAFNASLGADFTMEASLRLVSAKASHEIFDTRAAGGTAAPWVMGINGSSQLSLFTGSDIAPGSGLALNTWLDLAISRVGSAVYFFENGVLAGTGTYAPPLVGASLASGFTCRFGGKDGATYALHAYLNGFRLTNGLGRYTASYTPSGAAFPVSGREIFPMVALVDRYPIAFDRFSPFLHFTSPFDDDTMAHGLLPRAVRFFDVYNGGLGVIYGTVKEKHLPSNTPWRRKVLLIDEASQIVIRQTWSDVTTGEYEFRGIREGVKYTVISYDYTGAYNAVIADKQTPERVQ